MKNKRWFPVVYMFVVTAFFSAVIIGFAQMTQSRVEANQTRSFESAVLKVFPNMYDANETAVDLHNKFIEKVNEPTDDTAGAYTLKQNGKIVAYALPFTGQGFWAPIDGIIGIKSDRKTVVNMVIYQQRETPGLGAEVANEKFRGQFIDLQMADGSKPVAFRRPGEQLGPGQVHAVTGATQTSTRLEKIINNALIEWREKMNAMK